MMRLQDSHGAPTDEAGHARSLRAYLYDKYVYRQEESRHGDTKPVSETPIRSNLERPAA
jgi:hypothetical protein